MPPQKWALVTGVSAGGMGEGEMRALMGRGFNVFATNVNWAMLENVDYSKGKNGEYVVQLELDVTSKASIAAAVKEVESTTGGRLDVLISG